ncbi:ribosome biogenesis GTPase Der [Patescibacteria group bacterium]|nr:ribosome biogenesis GTPase Der [Patescibacteria group bacterium]
MDSAPTIAIVGRPNVGKSTLFNRLIGKKLAITAKEAGTTRDRIFHHIDVNGYDCILVDTGGLEYGKQENIEEDIQTQAALAINEANVILFVIDTIQDLTANDFAAAEILRKSKKQVIIVANKCDHPNIENNIYNIYELGFDEPVQISAIHKTGIDTLQHAIEKKLKEQKIKKSTKPKKQEDQIDLCIIGKPNAGKSSLINALTNSEKVIVSHIPGTTRDITDTELIFKDQKFNLIDTAGLRRPGKIEKGIEKFSALRVLLGIDRSEVVVLLIDGEKGLSQQDCHVASMAVEKEKGIILAINKIDLLEKGEEERDRIIWKLRKKMAFIPWAPVVFISAKNKRNTNQILQLAKEITKEREKRIPTPQLNSYLQKVTQKHLPASVKSRKPKFFYASQVDIRPPRFVLFFRNPKDLHFTYPRYLENQIRKEYGFNGTAISIKFKNKNDIKG